LNALACPGARTLEGLSPPCRFRPVAEEARLRFFNTPRRGLRPTACRRIQARGRSTGRPVRCLDQHTLRGQSPREHPAVAALNPWRSPGTSERVKAQEPRSVGPAQRGGAGATDGGNGRWVLPRGNAADTFREEKAPKGESQERCRHARRPARALEGVSRREGNQTLRAERSGARQTPR